MLGLRCKSMRKGFAINSKKIKKSISDFRGLLTIVKTTGNRHIGNLQFSHCIKIYFQT